MRSKPTITAAAAALALILPSAAGAQFIGPTSDGKAPTFSTKLALVAADVNGTYDSYARVGEETVLLTDGTAGQGAYLNDATGDGKIAYFNSPSRLTAEDTDDDIDNYVRTEAGVKLVSPQFMVFQEMTTAGASAFFTTSAKLSALDSDGHVDVYEHFTGTGEIILRTPGTPFAPANYAGYADKGGILHFTTSEPIHASDEDAAADVYLQLRSSSVVLPETTGGDGAHSTNVNSVANVSGRVIFTTSEQLVAQDTDAGNDLYASEGGGSTTLLSPSPNAAAQAKPVYFEAASKGAGHRVIFRTTEPLVAGDADLTDDVYSWGINGGLKLLTAGTAAPVTLEDVSTDTEVILFSTAEKLLVTDTDAAIDMYRSGDAGLVHVTKTNAAFDQKEGRLSPSGVLTAFETAEPMWPDDIDGLVDIYEKGPGGIWHVSQRDPASKGGPENDVAIDDYVGTNMLVFDAVERLLPVDLNDDWDVYGRATGSPMAMLTLAPVQAPATTAPAAPSESDPAPAESDPASPESDPAPAESDPGVGRDVAAPKVGAAKMKLRARRTPVLTFSLSEDATVKVFVQRKAGRKWKTVATKTLAGRAGKNAATLKTIARRGTFRLVLSATDRAGNRSAQTKLALRR